MDRKYVLPALGALLLAVGIYLYISHSSSGKSYLQTSAALSVSPPPPSADPSVDVRAAEWARQMADRKFHEPALHLQPLRDEEHPAAEDFQARLAAAAHSDEKVTPIALSFEQYVQTESDATRTFPLYTSKSIDPFITPYFMTQANPGAADESYYRAQTF